MTKQEYMKEYREKNKERLRQQQKEYHEKHREERNKQSSEYKKNNVVRMRIYWKKKNAEDYSEFCREKLKIKESGCVVCGYNRCEKALEFHHKDPSKKERIVSVFRSVESMKAEAAKCVVLCANCHRELHVGLISLEVPMEVAQ